MTRCPLCGARMRTARSSDICEGCRCKALLDSLATAAADAMLMDSAEGRAALDQAHALAGEIAAAERAARVGAR